MSTPSSKKRAVSAPPNTVLVLGLYEEDYLYHLFEFLMSSMRAVAQVKLVTKVKEAMAILGAQQPPSAVLSIDAAPTESKYRSLNEQLVRYAEAGGTVVFGCNFSNHFSFSSAESFFRAWGVSWALGDYHRTNVFLNKNEVLGMDLAGLETSYSVKALNLAQVHPSSAVYSPASTSHTQSYVFPPASVDITQTPAAYVKVKNGYMGYTGDVNAEKPTTKVIMAMLHLRIDLVGIERVGEDIRGEALGVSFMKKNHQRGLEAVGSGRATSPTPSEESSASSDNDWHETLRGIPPRIFPSVPRPREAEVKARATRRAKTTERKKAAAERLKDKGNDVFKAGNYEQAVDLYKRACTMYKPLPVYMSNLAAALLKLERWKEAEGAAAHATLVDPNFLKGHFRRGIARKHCEMVDGAIRDFKRCLKIDPNCAEAKVELEAAKKARLDEHDDGFDIDSDSETKLIFGLGPGFMPGRTLHVLDCPSDSEASQHSGKVPCRYYNHNGCQFGKTCRYKHAPDVRSVRDELGRNVCLHFLIERCKFDDRCWYAHDKSYLPSNGWWNEETMGEYQYLYDRLRSDTGDGVLDKIGGIMNGTAMPWTINATMQRLGEEVVEDSDEDDDEFFRGRGKAGRSRRFEREMDERAENFGFTQDEVIELLCQGVKPWDDDAWDVLNVLNGNY